MAGSGDGHRSSRKACSWRRCRSSRGIGRRTMTGASSRRKLNALPQFVTEIDGLDIHFIHVRSKHENALPLIVTHGWPGSIIEQLKIIEPLTDPTAHGASASDAFRPRDPVDAGLRVFGQADRDRLGSRPHRARLDRADEAPRLHAICGARRRLGQCRHGADGAAARRRNCSASTPTCRRPFRTTLRRRFSPASRRRPASRPTNSTPTTSSTISTSTASATRIEMANRPQTLYGDRGFAGRAGGLDARPRRAQSTS